jgi:hypothetical protein
MEVFAINNSCCVQTCKWSEVVRELNVVERDRAGEVHENVVGFPTTDSKVIFTLYRGRVCLKGGAVLLLIIVLCVHWEQEVQGTKEKRRGRPTHFS